jgi:adenylosuccinate lyase
MNVKAITYNSGTHGFWLESGVDHLEAVMLRIWTQKVLDAVGHLAATHPAHELLVTYLGINEVPWSKQVLISVAVLLLAVLLKKILDRQPKQPKK